MVLTEVERMQIAWFFNEEDYTISELSIMYRNPAKKILQSIKEFRSFYE